MNINLSKITARLVGKQYELGVVDCFRIIYEYLREIKVDIPDHFEGMSLNDYSKLYIEDRQRAKEAMFRFIDKYLIRISSSQAVAGDILVAKLGKADEFLAVDVGNGNMLSAAPRIGVNVISKRYYSIIGAYSCRRQSP